MSHSPSTEVSVQLLQPPFSHQTIASVLSLMETAWPVVVQNPEFVREEAVTWDGVVLAMAGRKAVGAAMFSTTHNPGWSESRQARFHYVVVEPTYRRGEVNGGQHVGTLLTTTRTQAVAGVGARSFSVDLTTPEARRLYDSLGFTGSGPFALPAANQHGRFLGVVGGACGGLLRFCR